MPSCVSFFTRINFVSWSGHVSQDGTASPRMSHQSGGAGRLPDTSLNTYKAAVWNKDSPSRSGKQLSHTCRFAAALPNTQKVKVCNYKCLAGLPGVKDIGFLSHTGVTVWEMISDVFLVFQVLCHLSVAAMFMSSHHCYSVSMTKKIWNSIKGPL